MTRTDDPEEEAKQKAFKGILNKLTPDNFERLSQQLLDVGITEAKTLIGLIAQVHGVPHGRSDSALDNSCPFNHVLDALPCEPAHGPVQLPMTFTTVYDFLLEKWPTFH